MDTQKLAKIAQASLAKSHVFLVPYRSRKDGVKYRYTYNVHEYDPHTNTVGKQLVERSTDPEFTTCRILSEQGCTGELYFWRNPRNYALKIKDITKGAQLKTLESSKAGPRIANYEPFEGLSINE